MKNTSNKTWTTTKFEENLKAFSDKFEARLLHGGLSVAAERAKRKENNLKWAWIKIGQTKKLQWVDNKTMKAYKADGYSQTNIEIPRFTFLRWATTFDL